MTPRDTTGRSGSRGRRLGAILLAASMLSACGKSEIVEPSDARVEPGFSVLEVKVAAVPKKGMKSAQTGGPVAGGYGEVEDGPESGRAFERVDYKKLEGVVVWAAPVEGQAFVPAADAVKDNEVAELRLRGDAHPRSRTFVVCAGGKLRLVNDASRAVKIYSVTEGNEFSVQLNANSKGEWVPKLSGPVEVLVAGIDDPIAIVYVAPSPWASVVKAGEVARFSHMPPGRYEVGSWHARLPGGRSPVLLTAGKVTFDQVSVGVDELQR